MQSGSKFTAIVAKLRAKRKSTKNAKGIAAQAGREKYAKDQFQAMAKAGQKLAAAKAAGPTL